MYKELDIVVIKFSKPEHNVYKGDIGTIVNVYKSGDAYEVEFNTYSGESIALITLKPEEIRNINKNERISVRELV